MTFLNGGGYLNSSCWQVCTCERICNIYVLQISSFSPYLHEEKEERKILC
ncbi:hypothetical protein HMPREF1584_01270 [Gardnerella vaginalis JCP8481A]|nr:hypothetical protein HMPREF1584_01270 [Gardnerella vaginalis JCP8481A]